MSGSAPATYVDDNAMFPQSEPRDALIIDLIGIYKAYNELFYTETKSVYV